MESTGADSGWVTGRTHIHKTGPDPHSTIANMTEDANQHGPYEKASTGCGVIGLVVNLSELHADITDCLQLV